MAARLPPGAETYRTHEGLIVIFPDGNAFVGCPPGLGGPAEQPDGDGEHAAVGA